MKTRTAFALAAHVIACLGATPRASAQEAIGPFTPTTFNFQGRVYENGLPAFNVYDFQFRLFDAPSNGLPAGPVIPVANVGVTNGYFNVALDFGPDGFHGAARWLEIQQRAAGANVFTPLSGRVPVLSTPVATYAYAAGTAAVASAVSPGGITAAALALGSVSSAAVANESICTEKLCPDLLDRTFWKVTGNYSTEPAVNFLGTKDNKALTIAVNDLPALRIFPDTAIRVNDLALPSPVEPSESPNLLGGFRRNVIDPDNKGAIIAGGGSLYDHFFHSPVALSGINVIAANSDYSFLGSGSANYLSGNRCVIAGGHYNRITNGNSSVISGGDRNLITILIGNKDDSSLDGGVIGGGQENTLTFGADSAVIGGGFRNTVTNFGAFIGAGGFNVANGAYSVIGGGSTNQTFGEKSVVVGGANNSARARHGAVGGGSGNFAGSRASVIAGGEQNFIGLTNDFATVLGGNNNTNFAPLATVLNGSGVLADKFGQVAFGTRFAASGDAQASFFHLRGITTGATSVALTLDGAGSQLRLARQSAWAFHALVVGKSSGTVAAVAFEVRGLAVNMDGATTVLATTTPMGSFAGIAGFNATAVTDDVNDALVLQVTSPANLTMRWSAQVETAEVNAP